MTRLLIVRHGETEWNQSRRYQGQRDIALNANGLDQAEMLARRLDSEDIVAAYSSDLQRAMRTAQAIISGRGLEIVPCPELRELDFGDFEGLSFEEIEQRFPEQIQAWMSRRVDVSPPSGENLMQLAQRVSSVVTRIERERPEGTVLVTAHSGPVRALLCTLLQIDLSYWWRFRIGTGALSIVETYPEGAVLTLLNETSFQNHAKENLFWPSP
ncbi:MAG: alpha-ribazole phosphatase [Chloroflexi bacterium]|nr:alpha-ribazole phosphatase [Chloroflexota bacterium]